jgi:hypothetical protein
LKFHTSHHFWFLLCKLLKDEGVLGPELPGRTHFDSRVPQFSSQGGFLMQPAFDSLPVDIDKHVINVELQIKEKFSCLLSEMAWPVFCRCLVKGKEFIDYNFCQVLCSLFILCEFFFLFFFLVMFSGILKYFVIPNPNNIKHGAFIMLSSFDGIQI